MTTLQKGLGYLLKLNKILLYDLAIPFLNISPHSNGIICPAKGIHKNIHSLFFSKEPKTENKPNVHPWEMDKQLWYIHTTDYHRKREKRITRLKEKGRSFEHRDEQKKSHRKDSAAWPQLYKVGTDKTFHSGRSCSSSPRQERHQRGRRHLGSLRFNEI